MKPTAMRYYYLSAEFKMLEMQLDVLFVAIRLSSSPVNQHWMIKQMDSVLFPILTLLAHIEFLSLLPNIPIEQIRIEKSLTGWSIL